MDEQRLDLAAASGSAAPAIGRQGRGCRSAQADRRRATNRRSPKCRCSSFSRRDRRRASANHPAARPAFEQSDRPAGRSQSRRLGLDVGWGIGLHGTILAPPMLGVLARSDSHAVGIERAPGTSDAYPWERWGLPSSPSLAITESITLSSASISIKSPDSTRSSVISAPSRVQYSRCLR